MGPAPLDQTPKSMSQWESQLTAIRSVVRSIHEATTAQNVDALMVDGTRSLLDADRVSLVQAVGNGKAPCVIRAISGVAQFDAKSDIVDALMELVREMNTQSPSDELLQRFTSQSKAIVAFVVPLHSDYGTCLVIEWMAAERYQSSAARVPFVMPLLVDAWQLRLRSNRTPMTRNHIFRWIVTMTVFAGLATFFLSKTELTILSEGTLKPSEQRFMFAPSDGFVDTIRVKDGQRVRKGEIVATLSSPQLQMQQNQVTAEIGLVDQKRSGLNITLNQISPNDPQANLIGSRLAGEVQELDAKRLSLLEQKRLLLLEQGRLPLQSPLDGTVIAWDVEKYLENRPVRRGETLFRIASLEGKWIVESSVADWESGYVLEAFQRANKTRVPMPVMVALASNPQRRQNARVERIGNTMFEGTEGQQLEVFIELDENLQDPRLGTSATVSIPCGRFPRWYVWTRSIIDGIHRRFWF